MNGSRVFTLTATDDFGCVNSNSVSITQFNSPNVVTQIDTVICDLPVNVTLMLHQLVETGSILILLIMVYTVQMGLYYEYTDFNTCYNIDSMLLTVNPAQKLTLVQIL